MKHCPICSRDKKVSDFGKCAARKDGKNLYCKECIRKKVTASRHALKEYKAAKKNRALPLFDDPEPRVLPLSRLPEIDRVKSVCGRQPKALLEIARDAKLNADLVEVLLTRLQLAREVVRSVNGDKALFALAPERPPIVIAARKPMQLSQGFSRLSGLMPGRKTG